MIKLAADFAKDLIRALYQLDDSQLKNKIKWFVIPWIKAVIIRFIIHALYRKLYQAKLNADAQTEQQIKQYITLVKNEINDLNALSLNKLEKFINDIAKLPYENPRGLNSYLQIINDTKTLSNNPSITNLNKLMDYLHNTSGFSMHLFAPLLGFPSTRPYLVALTNEMTFSLLNNLKKIIESDEELNYLEDSLNEVTQLLNQILNLKTKLLNKHPELKDKLTIEHPIQDLINLISNEPLAEELKRKYDLYLKKLSYLVGQIGGQSKLLQTLLFAGKQNLEDYLKQYLDYEEKKYLYVQQIVNKTNNKTIEPLSNYPASYIPDLSKHWCFYITHNKIPKFLNELELELSKIPDTKKLWFRLWLANALMLSEDKEALIDFMQAVDLSDAIKTTESKEEYYVLSALNCFFKNSNYININCDEFNAQMKNCLNEISNYIK